MLFKKKNKLPALPRHERSGPAQSNRGLVAELEKSIFHLPWLSFQSCVVPWALANSITLNVPQHPPKVPGCFAPFHENARQ